MNRAVGAPLVIGRIPGAMPQAGIEPGPLALDSAPTARTTCPAVAFGEGGSARPAPLKEKPRIEHGFLATDCTDCTDFRSGNVKLYESSGKAGGFPTALNN